MGGVVTKQGVFAWDVENETLEEFKKRMLEIDNLIVHDRVNDIEIEMRLGTIEQRINKMSSMFSDLLAEVRKLAEVVKYLTKMKRY